MGNIDFSPVMRFVGLGVFVAASFGCGSNDGGDTANGASSGGSATGSSSEGGTSGSTSAGATATGGTTGGTAGTCDPTQAANANMMGGATCSEVETCLESSCGSQVAACYGPGYQQGDFSKGQCATYLGCISQCNCEATCASQCMPDATCTSCLLAAGSCVFSQCLSQVFACAGDAGAVTGGASTGGTAAGSTGLAGFDGGIIGTGSFDGGIIGTGTSDGGTMATCANLSTCCESMSGTQKTGCEQILATVSPSDALCAEVLLGYQRSSSCP